MTDIITKEGVTVRVGQVWRDLDKRMNGRECVVTHIGYGIATMRNTAHPERKPTGVRIRRMHGTATGWALVSEAE